MRLSKGNFKCVYIFHIPVVGEKEVENGTVNVRTRDNKVHGEHSISAVIEKFKHFKSVKVADAEENF